MVISTRKAKVKFSEGDRVLCYEPDPTKAKVLYDSKVLDVQITRESAGRKMAEYLIHFSGWSSSWDRIVKEEYILPDTEENRHLQEKLAKEAATYLKGKKKNLHPMIRETLAKQDKSSDSERNYLNEDEEDSSSESEPEIELFPAPVIRHNVVIKIPASLREILLEDARLIKEQKKLILLPVKKCAMFILECYVTHATYHLLSVPVPPTPAEIEEAYREIEQKIEFAKEVMHELKVLMDYLLPRNLLYNEERKQYEITGSQIVFEKHVWKVCNSEHYKSCIECLLIHVMNCVDCSICHLNNCNSCASRGLKRCNKCQDEHLAKCSKCLKKHLPECKPCFKRHLLKCHKCYSAHCDNCASCLKTHVKVCEVCADEKKHLLEAEVENQELSPPSSPQISRRSLRSGSKRLSTDSDKSDNVPRKLRKSTLNQSQQSKELSIQAKQTKELKSDGSQNKDSFSETQKKELTSQEQKTKEALASKTFKNKETGDQGKKTKELASSSLKTKELASSSLKTKVLASLSLKNKELVNQAQKNKEATNPTSNVRELRSHAQKSKESPNKEQKHNESVLKSSKNKEMIREQETELPKKSKKASELPMRRNLRSMGKLKADDETVKEENSQELEIQIDSTSVKTDSNISTPLKKESSTDAAPIRKRTRSTRSSVSSDVPLSPPLSPVNDSAPPSSSQKQKTSHPPIQSPSSSTLPDSPLKTEENQTLLTYNPSLYNEVLTYDLMTESEFFNGLPAVPSIVYGAHHLLRFFVNVPATLNKLHLSEEKMAKIVDVIHDFLAYLEERKEEFFPPSLYVDYADGV